MFKNEVTVSIEDKREMMSHLEQVKSILDKYPMWTHFDYTVTNMQRAKEHVRNACEWVSYLDTRNDA